MKTNGKKEMFIVLTGECISFGCISLWFVAYFSAREARKRPDSELETVEPQMKIVCGAVM